MLTYGFYNSVSGDRTYNAEQFASIFDGVIMDGVFEHIGNHFAVTKSDVVENTVLVSTGKAWFDHTWTLNDAVLDLDAESKPLVQGQRRWDAVVIEVNRGTRINSIKIVHGNETSGIPSKPPLPKTGNVKQYALAYIYRTNEGDNHTDAFTITMVTGTTETPYVSGPLAVATIDEHYAQWQEQFQSMLNEERAEFEAWFEDLQDELDEDQAAHLLHLIQENTEEIADLRAIVDQGFNIPIATASDLGAVMIGDGLNITNTGILSAGFPSGIKAGVWNIFTLGIIELDQGIYDRPDIHKYYLRVGVHTRTGTLAVTTPYSGRYISSVQQISIPSGYFTDCLYANVVPASSPGLFETAFTSITNTAMSYYVVSNASLSQNVARRHIVIGLYEINE